MIVQCACCGYWGEVSDEWYSLTNRKRPVEKNPPTVFICDMCYSVLV